MPLQLACIADDITGASDLALILASNGMSVTQVLGVPGPELDVQTDAVVIALKIRTATVSLAVHQAVTAARHLLRSGASQLYFKYCSTFDSTAVGNIGPVTEALLDCVNADFTVICPAFPANGRIIRDGVLLVNGQPLAESPMRHHPLTPMTKSSLLELMDEQTQAGATGLVELATVRAGSAVIEQRFAELRHMGKRFAVVDSEQDSDLVVTASACKNLKLITGASALAMGLPANFRQAGAHGTSTAFAPLPANLPGNPVVLAGSCSLTTRKQVEFMSRRHASILVDPLRLQQEPGHLQQLQQQARTAWQAGPVLAYSSSDAGQVRQAQHDLGLNQSAELVERALASIAADLATQGASKFIVAGGETSGAVAEALRVNRLLTGPRIDEGIPWMINEAGQPMVLAFKSGNFGHEDFFIRAMAMLDQGPDQSMGRRTAP